MKNNRDNDKESEEEDLDKEAPENHVLAHLDFIWGFCAGKKSASYRNSISCCPKWDYSLTLRSNHTSALHQERNNVSDYEDLCQP